MIYRNRLCPNCGLKMKYLGSVEVFSWTSDYGEDWEMDE